MGRVGFDISIAVGGFFFGLKLDISVEFFIVKLDFFRGIYIYIYIYIYILNIVYFCGILLDAFAERGISESWTNQ